MPAKRILRQRLGVGQDVADLLIGQSLVTMLGIPVPGWPHRILWSVSCGLSFESHPTPKPLIESKSIVRSLVREPHTPSKPVN